MCKEASGILTKDREFWSKKSDSHEDIIAEFKLHEGEGRINFVRFEISPLDGNLSLPLKDWVYKLDQTDLPDWYDATDAEKRARAMLKKWAAEKLTGWNLKEAFAPIDPLTIQRKPLSRKEAIKLAKTWTSVWDSVRDSVWDSVWDSVGASVGASVRDSVWDSVRASVWASVGASVRDSVWDSVRASVWAYIGSLFVPRIKSWKYAEKLGANPWKPLRELWTKGYVPSFDGKTWRLHAGPKADVVFEFTQDEIWRAKCGGGDDELG